MYKNQKCHSSSVAVMFLGVAFQKSTPPKRARPLFTCAGALTAECTHPYTSTPVIHTYAYTYSVEAIMSRAPHPVQHIRWTYKPSGGGGCVRGIYVYIYTQRGWDRSRRFISVQDSLHHRTVQQQSAHEYCSCKISICISYGIYIYDALHNYQLVSKRRLSLLFYLIS